MKIKKHVSKINAKILIIFGILILLGVVSQGTVGAGSMFGGYSYVYGTFTVEDRIAGSHWLYPEPVPGKAEYISVLLYKSNTAVFKGKVGIYEYGSNDWVGNSSEVAMPVASGWLKVALDGDVILKPNTQYWLVLWSNASALGICSIFQGFDEFYYDSRVNYAADVYDGIFPATFANTSGTVYTNPSFCHYSINYTENYDYVNCTGTFEHNEGGYWINSSGNWSHYVAFRESDNLITTIEFNMMQLNIIISIILMMFFIITGYSSKNMKTSACLLIFAGLFTILAMLSTVAYFSGIWYLSSPVFILISMIFFKDAYLNLTS